jgi:hypothetical protein
MALNYSKNVNKVCNLSQYDSIFYIFEIEIKSDETTTIRRIKNSREGQLFNTDDMVDNNIDKIKFTIFDFNDPTCKIVMKKKFTELIDNIVIISNNNLIIYLYNQDNYINCNYKFIN